VITTRRRDLVATSVDLLEAERARLDWTVGGRLAAASDLIEAAG
jgi:hypothetical protein